MNNRYPKDISACDEGGSPIFFLTTSYIATAPAVEPDSPPDVEVPAVIVTSVIETSLPLSDEELS